jgi:hypothetical protein
MTGSSIINTVGQGTWTVEHDGGVPGTVWSTITWNTERCVTEPEPRGTSITVEARAAETLAGLGSQIYLPVSNGADLASIIGRYIQIKVTLNGQAQPFLSPILCDLSVSALCNQTIEANLDIRPGVCPNNFNVYLPGVLVSSVLGTNVFDVDDVDTSTLQISRVDGVGTPVNVLAGSLSYGDFGTPFSGDECDCHTLTGDGFEDLYMKFDKQTMIDHLNFGSLECGTVLPLRVSGLLNDGTPFESIDCIVIVD